MGINWFDKRVMPLMQYDITMQITHNDKNTDKYKLRLFFRHGLENQITSNGLIKIGIDPDRDRISHRLTGSITGTGTNTHGDAACWKHQAACSKHYRNMPVTIWLKWMRKTV